MGSIVALSGMMGSGKTLVGRILARMLDWEFVDLDEEIERRQERTIDEIFSEQGEDFFRREEVWALRGLLEQCENRVSFVVALGGGTVTVPAAVRLLNERGCSVVWLHVDPDEAWKRAEGSSRPLAQDRREFLERAAAREIIYRRTADIQVSTVDRTPEEVAQDIRLRIDRGAEA